MNLDQVRFYAPQIRQIAQRFGVEKVHVFGSVARDEAQSSSDFDLLVELQDGVSLFKIASFAYEVERLLKVKVDVIPMALLPEIEDKAFVTQIQQEAILL